MEDTALLEGEDDNKVGRKHKFHHEVVKEVNEEARRRERLQLCLCITAIIVVCVILTAVIVFLAVFG